MTIKNIAIVTLGCSTNEIDSELMTGILKDNDYKITNSLEEADTIIINTCGFIEDAKTESIEMIWEMTKYKESGNCKYLILAGCLAERYSKELLEEIEEIDGIIGTGNIRDIVKIIKNLEDGEERIRLTKNINSNYPEKIQRQSFNHTEYVKISEGCDNFCTYCIIPKLRGNHRSREMEDIVKEVEFLVANGVEEIILIGQNTTDYGIDLYDDYKLYELLNKLNKIKDLKWIRILYLYPDNITDKLILSIKNNDKVVEYVDIPLQHISDNVLKNMNRNTSKKAIENLILKLRKEIPDIIIRTTFIVGFPGETETYFNELYNFIKNIKFDKLGVFTYSKEEGTPAYNYANQIDDNIKEQRRNLIMELQQGISYSLNSKKVGKNYKALIEEIYDENSYMGRTYMDSPDIDGIVIINSERPLQIGEWVNIKITDYLEYDLIGEITYELSE